MDHDCNHAHCTASPVTKSVCQTLSEMDWERGIWNAAFGGDRDRVNKLIDKANCTKEAVNAPDNSGYTALHYAARNGHVDICKLLLQYGADINAETRTGHATPLHKAAAAGKSTTLSFLLKKGARIDVQDVDGRTALHKAVENKHEECISLLLNACPPLRNIKDFKGKLPLGVN